MTVKAGASAPEVQAAALVLDAVSVLCTGLEPGSLPSGSVAAVFDALVQMGRLVDGAITRLAPRFERSGAWQDRGARSAEDALARALGSSPADAKRRLDTGNRLTRQRRLDDALRRGQVSADQAEVISGAAGDPAAESKLIDTARSSSHRGLRDEAARERARADHDETSRRDRQHRLRCLKRWTDADGMYNLLLRTLPEHGAEIDARLKPLIDDEFDQARRQGRREDVPAYGADVVSRLLRGHPAGDDHVEHDGRGGRQRHARRRSQAVRPERKVIALVDIDALNRGHTRGEETCEIAGIGPVSVAAVRAMFGDAALTAVFRDTVDIRAVVHLGRQVTAHQRTALEARGPVCAIVGCGSTHHLEIDHTIGWTYTQTTNVDDLDWLCSTDHRFKTRHNLLAIGPPGARVLVERDPDDPTKPRQPLVQLRPAPTPTAPSSASSTARESTSSGPAPPITHELFPA